MASRWDRFSSLSEVWEMTERGSTKEVNVTVQHYTSTMFSQALKRTTQEQEREQC